MPEAIVSRILRLPGYGVYAWEAGDATSLLMPVGAADCPRTLLLKVQRATATRRRQAA